MTTSRDRRDDRWRMLCPVVVVAGPLLALALLAAPPPEGLSVPGWRVAVIGALMALWWMTEVVPLPVTALLPVTLFPLTGVMDLDRTAAAYADPLIFLFLGGFILARALQRWRLDRRVALAVLRLAGGRPHAIVAGVMAVTAFFSMWVSNTATAMMMLPIGQSVIAAFEAAARGGDGRDLRAFSAALMLAIAYAASIGGMGTLIGTPPNALFAGFMRETYRIEIGFAEWMAAAMPVVIVLLPLTWLVLTRVAFRFSLEPLAGAGETPVGPMSRAEKTVAGLLCAVAAGWMLRPVIDGLAPGLRLSDAGIVMTAAIALFMIPSGAADRAPLLTWDDAARLPWGVLILFGGGLALAKAITAAGLAAWLGDALSALGALPLVAVVVTVAVVVVYLGELASNTAMAAIFLPIAGAVAIGLGHDPVTLALPVALAASVGFMLPVATPPNAIVFASGTVTARQMLRAGFILDLVGIAVVVAVAMTTAAWVLARA